MLTVFPTTCFHDVGIFREKCLSTVDNKRKVNSICGDSQLICANHDEVIGTNNFTIITYKNIQGKGDVQQYISEGLALVIRFLG